MFRVTDQMILAAVMAPDGSDRFSGLGRNALFTALRHDIEGYRRWTHRTDPQDRDAQVDSAFTEFWLSIRSRRWLFVSSTVIGWAFRNSDFVDEHDLKPIREAERNEHGSGNHLSRPTFVDPQVFDTIRSSIDPGRLERLYPVYQLLVMSIQWWPLWEIHCMLSYPNSGDFSAWYLGSVTRQNNLSPNYPGWHKSSSPWTSHDYVTDENGAEIKKLLMKRLYGEFLIAAICPRGQDCFEAWLDTLFADPDNLSEERLTGSLVFGPLSALAKAASLSEHYPKCALALTTLLLNLHESHGPNAGNSETHKDMEIDNEAVADLKGALKEFLSFEGSSKPDLQTQMTTQYGEESSPSTERILNSSLYRWLKRLPFPFPKIKDPPAFDRAMLAVLSNVGELAEPKSVSNGETKNAPEIESAEENENTNKNKGPVPRDVYVNHLKLKIESLNDATAARSKYRKAIATVVAALCQGEDLHDISGGLFHILPVPMDVKKQTATVIAKRLTEWLDWINQSKKVPDAQRADSWIEREMPTGFGKDLEQKRQKLVPVIFEAILILEQPGDANADRHLYEVCSLDVEVVIRQAWFTCILEDLTEWSVEAKKTWEDKGKGERPRRSKQ